MIFQFRRVLSAAGMICAVTMAPITASADSRANIPSGSEAQSDDGSDRRIAHNGLNLLSSASPRTTSKSRKRVVVGSGSYICSPAGFGQRSRCYSN